MRSVLDLKHLLIIVLYAHRVRAFIAIANIVTLTLCPYILRCDKGTTLYLKSHTIIYPYIITSHCIFVTLPLCFFVDCNMRSHRITHTNIALHHISIAYSASLFLSPIAMCDLIASHIQISHRIFIILLCLLTFVLCLDFLFS